jgi:hypothetical protein
MTLAQTTATSVSLGATAETLVCSTPILTVTGQGNSTGYVIRGSANVTTGTVSSVTLRVRQGGALTGNVVGNPLTVSTSNVSTYQLGFSAIDASPQSATQYTFSVQQNSGTSTGTANYAELDLDIAAG